MRHFSDDDRRARIARRHGLHPQWRHGDIASTTAAMTVLHATEPASIHLAARARTTGLTVSQVSRALYEDHVLVSQLAMRRTLFVFPRDLLPAAWGSASARVARQERTRLVTSLSLTEPDPAGLLDRARAAVLERLATGDLLDVASLRTEVPITATPVASGSGRWQRTGPMGPRLLTLLNAEALVVRAGNAAGGWSASRPLWAARATWLADVPGPTSERDGYAALVRRWLWTFGPGTDRDIAWWLGATLASVRAALGDVEAVRVGLDDGATGWVLPGDDAPEEPVSDWAALLPTLDPTTMGWRGRDHYLDPTHVGRLFDSVGNAGPTVWWNGRIVGSWAQEPDSTVRTVLLSDPGPAGRAAIAAEAVALTTWLDGTVLRSPLPPA